jgi:hypothetical protein
VRATIGLAKKHSKNPPPLLWDDDTKELEGSQGLPRQKGPKFRISCLRDAAAAPDAQLIPLLQAVPSVCGLPGRPRHRPSPARRRGYDHDPRGRSPSFPTSPSRGTKVPLSRDFCAAARSMTAPSHHFSAPLQPDSSVRLLCLPRLVGDLDLLQPRSSPAREAVVRRGAEIGASVGT